MLDYKVYYQWLKDSIFIYPLFLSLASASIFYLAFSFIPKRKEHKNIEDQVIYHAERILNDLLFIIQDATNSNIDQPRIRSHILAEDEVRKAMTGVFFDTALKHLRANKDGKPMKVGEAVANGICSLKNESDILFHYLYHLDTQLINYVNEALRNIMNESWVNAYKMPSVKIGGRILTPVRTDVSHYALLLCEYNLTYRKIEDYLFRKYAKHRSIIRRKFFHFFYDKQDWDKGLKIAKELYKFKEHQSESAIFIIKAYIKLNRFDEARKSSERYIKQNIIGMRALGESFHHDKFFKSTDFEILYSNTRNN